MDEAARRKLRDLEATKAAGLPVDYAQAFASQARVSRPTVRVLRPFGGCRELGPLVKETEKSFLYQDSAKVTKRIGKTTKAKHARFPDPQPHIVPCRSCKDHPETYFGPGACIHGNTGFCETCASM